VSQSVTPDGMTPEEHVRMLAETSPGILGFKAVADQILDAAALRIQTNQQQHRLFPLSDLVNLLDPRTGDTVIIGQAMSKSTSLARFGPSPFFTTTPKLREPNSIKDLWHVEHKRRPAQPEREFHQEIMGEFYAHETVFPDGERRPSSTTISQQDRWLLRDTVKEFSHLFKDIYDVITLWTISLLSIHDT